DLESSSAASLTSTTSPTSSSSARARSSRARFAALAIVAAIGAPVAAAQVPTPVPTDTGSVAPAAPDSGRFKLTPILAPAYNPEMQFLIAGGFLVSWKVGDQRQKLLMQRSTLSATVSFSTTGAINVSTTLTSFWAEDRLRIMADIALKDMPDN